jgi:hypothetical protein
MDKNARVMMLVDVVEKNEELQEYFIKGTKDEEVRLQVLADIEKWYGLSETDLKESVTYMTDVFGVKREARIWRWF